MGIAYRMGETYMNIRNMPVGTSFLARNKYGQLSHFRLVGKHLADDGRVFFKLANLDDARERIQHAYSERDMLEYTQA